MNIFISYARVDKPLCIQLVEMLSVHDVWYDQRLYAGQHWWKEILRRLDWCDTFVYLISSESLVSEYCQKELDIARRIGREIIPILIQADIELPSDISKLQCIDMSQGFIVDNVTLLLNLIVETERLLNGVRQSTIGKIIPKDQLRPTIIPSDKIVMMAANALEKGLYDRAIFLFKQAKANEYKSRFININALIAEAEDGLEKQARMKDMKLEYIQIAELFNYQVTLSHALEAFKAFQLEFPDYDPRNLKRFLDTSQVATTDNIPIGSFSSLSVDAQSQAVENTGTDAQVRSDAEGLRLRQLPTTDSPILLNLNAKTALTVLGQNTDASWVLVEVAEGIQGWVAIAYLDVYIDLDTVEVITNSQSSSQSDLAPVVDIPHIASIGGDEARQIYLRGQQMGKKRNVFTTIGDSLTDTPHFLRNIAYGYNLRDYDYLLSTLEFFDTDTGHGNAYNRRSISAHAGWSSFSVVDAKNSPTICEADELPINCEYRLVKPSLALVMIGTNDAPAFSPEQYRVNLTQIIEISSQNGVIPVLSTLPPRAEFNDKIMAYNNIIRQLVASYEIPLWDFYDAVSSLPDSGYGPDGIHLSLPPAAPASTMDFTVENLQYGTTMRNLTALHTLKSVLENVMY